MRPDWGRAPLSLAQGSQQDWVQFTVVLDGPPMAPVGCDFDGTPCTFHTAAGP